MTKRLLIGLHGYAGAGKDTAAQALWGTHAFTRLAFADPLKEACAAAFGVALDKFYATDLKDEIIPYWGISPREMMQRMGTEAIRGEFGATHWVRRLASTYDAIKDTDDVVISDVREEHEATWIRENGGTVIHLYSDRAPRKYEHRSENGIALHESDYRIGNNGSKQDLAKTLTNIIVELEAQNASR